MSTSTSTRTLTRTLTRTRTRVRTGAALAAAALGLGLAGASPAAAADPHTGTLTTGLAFPQGLAVTGDADTVYVAQAGKGAITAVSRDGTKHDVLTGIRGEVAGLYAEPTGGVAYTFTGGTEKAPVAQLKLLGARGHVSTLGDLGTAEARLNPDRVRSYGFQGLSPSCAKQVPAEIGGEPYSGIVDSHPYAVTRLPDGTHVVADAAANALWHVGPDRQVRPLAVLPAQPLVVTAALARQLHLPRCVVGHAYAFESVPTDVERGLDGMLYVSTLPGGPEDPSLGARGSVYRVDPATGATRRLATGFAGATDLAVGPHGRIYVAELFGDRVSYVSHGRPVPVAALPSPIALEFQKGVLYVADDLFARGGASIVTVSQ